MLVRTSWSRRRRAVSDIVALVNDSFDRGDSTTLGNTDGLVPGYSGGDGLTWVEDSGDWEIFNNGVRSVGVHPGGAAWTATVDIAVAPTLANPITYVANGAPEILMAFAFRVSDTNNKLFASWDSANNRIRLSKREGSNTQLGETSPVIIDSGTTYRFKVIDDGAEVKIYLDGTLHLTVAETFNNTATKCGLYMGGANGHFHDFVAF
jgi:hypothetical protein